MTTPRPTARLRAIEALQRALSLAVAEARQPSREIEAERDAAADEFIDECVLAVVDYLNAKGPRR